MDKLTSAEIYFKGNVHVRRLTFDELLERLRAQVTSRIRNGEITERALARRAGFSQSHIHNVLKGVRVLTPAVADRVLREMNLSVLDLMGLGETPRKQPATVRRQRADKAASR